MTIPRLRGFCDLMFVLPLQRMRLRLLERQTVKLAHHVASSPKARVEHVYDANVEMGVALVMVPLFDAIAAERGPLPFVPGRVERIAEAAEEADADEHAAGIVTHDADTHAPPTIERPRRDDEEAAWDERNCGERWE